jgi:hypothetical protein
MGMIKIDLQVATFKKYEFELKNKRYKDTTFFWAHATYFCVQTFKHHRILVRHVLLTQVWILKFLVSYFVEFVLNFQWQRLMFFNKNFHHDNKNNLQNFDIYTTLKTTKLKEKKLSKRLLKIQYLLQFRSKNYKITSTKSYTSLHTFQQYQKHTLISLKLLILILLNSQWENYSIFNNSCILNVKITKQSWCTLTPTIPRVG